MIENTYTKTLIVICWLLEYIVEQSIYEDSLYLHCNTLCLSVFSAACVCMLSIFYFVAKFQPLVIKVIKICCLNWRILFMVVFVST